MDNVTGLLVTGVLVAGIGYLTLNGFRREVRVMKDGGCCGGSGSCGCGGTMGGCCGGNCSSNKALDQDSKNEEPTPGK